MKICFVDSTKLPYSFKDLKNEKIRGAESSLINLSKHLCEMGNQVTVYNNCDKEFSYTNYEWLNINRLNQNVSNFDIVISNNDTKILSKFICKKKFVLSHSLLTIEKAIRKKQLISYFLNKPTYLLLGKYHKNKMSKIFSIYKSKIINYGVDETFYKTSLPEQNDTDLSFFVSRQDRNLNILLDVWQNQVYPKRRKSKLFVTPIKEDLKKYNIFNRKMVDRDELIKQLIISRMIIIPGHKAELFCIAALEASELCIPIVTMGIGSLSERVEHQVTGLISKNTTDFAKNILDMYKDNNMWLEIRDNLLKKRGKNSWKKAASEFFRILNN